MLADTQVMNLLQIQDFSTFFTSSYQLLHLMSKRSQMVEMMDVCVSEGRSELGQHVSDGFFTPTWLQERLTPRFEFAAGKNGKTSPAFGQNETSATPDSELVS